MKHILQKTNKAITKAKAFLYYKTQEEDTYRCGENYKKNSKKYLPL
jgi:hypothetical protein